MQKRGQAGKFPPSRVDCPVDRGVDRHVDSPVDLAVDLVQTCSLDWCTISGVWVGLGGWFLECSEI